MSFSLLHRVQPVLCQVLVPEHHLLPDAHRHLGHRLERRAVEVGPVGRPEVGDGDGARPDGQARVPRRDRRHGQDELGGLLPAELVEALRERDGRGAGGEGAREGLCL